MKTEERGDGGQEQYDQPVTPIVSQQDEAVDQQKPTSQQQRRHYSKSRTAINQVIGFLRRFDTWDRDDVEVVFSSVVAFASFVGIAGIALTYLLTQRSLEETRRATKPTGEIGVHGYCPKWNASDLVDTWGQREQGQPTKQAGQP